MNLRPAVMNVRFMFAQYVQANFMFQHGRYSWRLASAEEVVDDIANSYGMYSLDIQGPVLQTCMHLI